MPLRVLGGRTGSGKTELLQALAAAGEQVIDLEALANPRARPSAGWVRAPAFQRTVREPPGRAYRKAGSRSPRLDRERKPYHRPREVTRHSLRSHPQRAVTELVVPDSVRRERILHEYGSFPVEQLAEKTAQLKTPRPRTHPNRHHRPPRRPPPRLARLHPAVLRQDV